MTAKLGHDLVQSDRCGHLTGHYHTWRRGHEAAFRPTVQQAMINKKSTAATRGGITDRNFFNHYVWCPVQVVGLTS